MCVCHAETIRLSVCIKLTVGTVYWAHCTHAHTRTAAADRTRCAPSPCHPVHTRARPPSNEGVAPRRAGTLAAEGRPGSLATPARTSRPLSSGLPAASAHLHPHPPFSKQSDLGASNVIAEILVRREMRKWFVLEWMRGEGGTCKIRSVEGALGAVDALGHLQVLPRQLHIRWSRVPLRPLKSQ